jgi:hypothetical protein
MPTRRNRGRPRTLTEEYIDEILARLMAHDERLRAVEVGQAKMLGALVFIAAEVPIIVALAALFLKSGQ